MSPVDVSFTAVRPLSGFEAVKRVASKRWTNFADTWSAMVVFSTFGEEPGSVCSTHRACTHWLFFLAFDSFREVIHILRVSQSGVASVLHWRSTRTSGHVDEETLLGFLQGVPPDWYIFRHLI